MSEALVVPLKAARLLCLHLQGLATPNGQEAPSTPGNMRALVQQLGCVQIDTLQMAQRSQYLALWSRFGTYNPADFDRLQFEAGERLLFEGWQHAASIIPLEDYRYQMPMHRRLKEQRPQEPKHWTSKAENQALMQATLERIRQEGPLRTNDFANEGPKRGSWWDWKPSKIALEYLFMRGDLMISRRVNFQRVYDLTERVLPDWVERSEPSIAERDEYWIESALRRMGLGNPSHVANYAYLYPGATKKTLEKMQRAGKVQTVLVETAGGGTEELWLHKDNLELLQRCLDGEIRAGRTTFLTPFDSLLWPRGRDVLLWGFQSLIELYKPQPQRIWGYYVLPILHGERLVGRFDVKLERKSGLLRLIALYLQEDVAVTDELTAGMQTALRDFMQFHTAKDLAIERCTPEAWAQEILRGM